MPRAMGRLNSATVTVVLLGLLESQGARNSPPGGRCAHDLRSKSGVMRLRGGAVKMHEGDPVSYANGPIIDMITDGWWSRSKWLRDNKMYHTDKVVDEVRELGRDFGRNGDVGQALLRRREQKRMEEEGAKGAPPQGGAVPAPDAAPSLGQAREGEVVDEGEDSVWSEELEEEAEEGISEPGAVEEGWIKGAQGDLAAARAGYEEAMRADARDAEAINNLASLLVMYPAHHDEAESLFRRALEMMPGDPLLRGNLAFLLSQPGMQAKGGEEAGELFRLVLEALPEDIGTLNNYALYQSNFKKNHTYARVLLEKAARIDCDMIITLGNLANLAHVHLREERFIETEAELGPHYNMSGVEFARALTLKTVRLDPSHSWVQEYAHKILMDPVHRNERARDSDYEMTDGVGMTRLNRATGVVEAV